MKKIKIVFRLVALTVLLVSLYTMPSFASDQPGCPDYRPPADQGAPPGEAGAGTSAAATTTAGQAQPSLPQIEGAISEAVGTEVLLNKIDELWPDLAKESQDIKDIDGDGIRDITTTNYKDGRVEVRKGCFLPEDAGTIETTWPDGRKEIIVREPFVPKEVDLNGDGNPDVYEQFGYGPTTTTTIYPDGSTITVGPDGSIARTDPTKLSPPK